MQRLIFQHHISLNILQCYYSIFERNISYCHALLQHNDYINLYHY